MQINANKVIERLKNREDRMSDKITTFAGSMDFVRIHAFWFGLWILINLGIFGSGLIFDKFPFGLLTLIVSLEAIFLSTFVMISQNHQAKSAEIRSELDYQVNLKAEKEIDLLLKALERLAIKNGIDVEDLRKEFQSISKSSGGKIK